MTRGKRRNLGWVSGVVAGLLCLFVASGSEARASGLDPTFGSSGRVITPFAQTDAVSTAVAPDGGVLFAQGSVVTHDLPSGTEDPSFGVEGRAVLPGTVDGLVFEPGAMRVDGKGRILFFGTASDSSQIYREPLSLLSAEASWIVVLRLNALGQLDQSFGNGKGYIRSDFGLTSPLEADFPLVSAASARIDSLGRPIFVARVADLTGPCNLGHTAITAYPRAVVRLTETGNLDATFGGDGIVDISGSESPPSLGLDLSNGATVAVGSRNCKAVQLRRFSENGLPASTFGSQGVRAYPNLLFSLVDASGSIILRKGDLTSTALVRLKPDGESDRSFGSDGTARIRLPFPASRRRLQPVAVDSQQRTLLVGSLRPRELKGRFHRNHHRSGGKNLPSPSYLAITRLTPSGRTDRGFGRDGWILTRFDRPRELDVRSASLDAQGRLLVVLSSSSALQPPGPRRIVLARYLLAG
jgi:uncharacterized delta-60 repeat protein